MANAGLVGRSFSSDIRHLRRKRALAPEASRLKSPVYLGHFCRTYPSFVRVKRSDPQILLLAGFLSADFKHGALRFHAIQDRKSTRLNSSHSQISYAVFCLKKKKKESTL